MLNRNFLFTFLFISFLPTSYNEAAEQDNSNVNNDVINNNNDNGGCILAEGDVLVEDCDRELLTGQECK